MPNIMALSEMAVQFLDLLEESGGVFTPEVDQMFSELMQKGVQAVVPLCNTIDEITARMEARKAKAKVLTDLAKKDECMIETAHKYIIKAMKACGQDKLTSGALTVTLCKGNPSVDIVDEDAVPLRFKTATIKVNAVDLDAVKVVATVRENRGQQDRYQTGNRRKYRRCRDADHPQPIPADKGVNMEEIMIKPKTAEEEAIIDGAISILSASGGLKKFDVEQKRNFIRACVAMKLNPILKEVHAVPYWDNELKRYNLGTIPDYSAYLNRAERSGQLDGWKTEYSGKVVFKKLARRKTRGDGGYDEYNINVIDTEKTDLCGIITIYRKDWTHPFVSRPLQLVHEMQDTPFWHGDPYGMLEKNLIREFFAKVFPKDCDFADYSKEAKVAPNGDEAVEETVTPKPGIELAQYVKQGYDLLNGVQLSGSDWERYRSALADAYRNGNVADLETIIYELEALQKKQLEKVAETRKKTAKPAPLPAEPAPLPAEPLPAEPAPYAEKHRPVQENVPPSPEKQKETLAKERIIDILNTLARAKFDNFEVPTRIKNSIKEHLGVIVGENEDWTTAILCADVLDIQTWRNAYKHWANYKKADDTAKEIRKLMAKLPEDAREGYENDLKVYVKDLPQLEELLAMIENDLGRDE